MRHTCWVAYVFVLHSFGHGSLALTSAGFGIFVAASAEEIAFRLLLPSALLRSLSYKKSSRLTAIAAILIAQLAFAAAHLGHRSPTSLHPFWVEAIRLTVAGMLYFVLVQRAGLWLAVGSHGALNAVKFFSVPHDIMFFPALASGALLAVLVIRDSTRQLPRVSPRTTVHLFSTEDLCGIPNG